MNAGFDESEKASDDLVIDTDDEKENGEKEAKITKIRHEEHNEDPCIDCE